MTDTEASVSWLRPHDGAGSWTKTPKHRPVVVDVGLAFLASLIFFTLVAGLYLALRPVVCDINHNELRYCPGFHETISETQP